MPIKFTKKYDDYLFSVNSADKEQFFIVISVTNRNRNCYEVFSSAYREAVEFMKKNNINIFHERIFGSNSLYEQIKNIRFSILRSFHYDEESFTYLEGNPYWGQGIAGISIHGVVMKKNTSIQKIYYKSTEYGKLWDSGNEQYIMLQSVHGKEDEKNNTYQEFTEMYKRTQFILSENGFTFKHITRTWVYLASILEDYDNFNPARNDMFKAFGLLDESINNNNYEKIYIPASTGIGCNNPMHMSAVMDILAIKKKEKSDLNIYTDTGTEQKAAYRYGSAFSRAIILDSNKSKYLYLSGTASIDTSGKSVFLNDIDKQINMTGEVINSLIRREQLTMSNIGECTVFLKRPEYIDNYEAYLSKNKLTDIPNIITVVDICRDDLLYEMDATFTGN